MKVVTCSKALYARCHNKRLLATPARRVALAAVPERYPQNARSSSPQSHPIKPQLDEFETKQVSMFQVAAEGPVAMPATHPPDNRPAFQKLGSGAMLAAAGFFVVTLTVAMGKFYTNYNKAENVARRKMLKNKEVVTALSDLLPEKRSQVTSGLIRKLSFSTGFSSAEIFRKFLWFVLRERKFDQDAYKDLLHVKEAAGLSNDEVAEALKERCIRIEKKYGNLMLQTEGLSEQGLRRKATCRALFSKMLYLIESEEMLKPNDTMSLRELRNIFGATEDDVAQLRIVSLQELDLDVLDNLASWKEKQ